MFNAPFPIPLGNGFSMDRVKCSDAHERITKTFRIRTNLYFAVDTNFNLYFFDEKKKLPSQPIFSQKKDQFIKISFEDLYPFLYKQPLNRAVLRSYSEDKQSQFKNDILYLGD